MYYIYIIKNRDRKIYKYVFLKKEMAKRICVTLPHEDFNFCTSRKLSPSKLLQERITQIRDEQNPQLRENLKEQQRRNENLYKKIEHFQKMFLNFGDKIKAKYGEDVLNEMIDNI